MREAERAIEYTNHDMSQVSDPSAVDLNRYNDNEPDEPMDGGGYLPLIGPYPWEGGEGGTTKAVEDGKVTCWVCNEHPQITKGVKGLVYCCMCCRASTGDKIKYWGEFGRCHDWADEIWPVAGVMTKQEKIIFQPKGITRANKKGRKAG